MSDIAETEPMARGVCVRSVILLYLKALFFTVEDTDAIS